MEKFYIVPEGTKLYEDFRAYEESEGQVNECYKAWKELVGAGASSYVPNEKRLGIIPTVADLEKFAGEFLESKGNDVRLFKKSAKANKAWVRLVSERSVKFISKPYMPAYFDYPIGTSWSNIFRVNDIPGTVYCHFETEHDGTEITSRDALIEIKGSEYYKAIEDHNERCKAKQEDAR